MIRGSRQPRIGDMSAQLEMDMVCLSKESADRYNHFGRDGTLDSKVRHVFNEHIPLYQKGKEHIPLDHKDPDDEEKVDYEGNTDTYLVESKVVGFEGDAGGSSYMQDDEPRLETRSGAGPISIPSGGEFEPMPDFNDASNAIKSELIIDVITSMVPVPVSSVRYKLIIIKTSDEDDDASVSPILAGVRS
ncbi:uncharacterized protein A4U43_C08F19470 [Asparagus officinalis]|nr:uncharacterized protein A4U43_C08F19470 [Asparagus officinalis]